MCWCKRVLVLTARSSNCNASLLPEDTIGTRRTEIAVCTYVENPAYGRGNIGFNDH